MSDHEKEHFCQLLAALFSPPDREMVNQIHGGSVHAFFRKAIEFWDGGSSALAGFLTEGDPETLLMQLGREHERLFSELNGKGVSLVESTYKTWTQDPSCTLPFASERGLLMGDSAMHLQEVYRACGLEVPGEFRGLPDHLALELEFLSCLYREAADAEITQFIEDHLDWIPCFRQEVSKLQPRGFYRSLSEVLDLFLRREKERLSVTA